MYYTPTAELPLEFPDGTTPVTCRVSIYDSSTDSKVSVGSSMDRASAPPLTAGSLYMEEVHVKVWPLAIHALPLLLCLVNCSGYYLLWVTTYSVPHTCLKIVIFVITLPIHVLTLVIAREGKSRRLSGDLHCPSSIGIGWSTPKMIRCRLGIFSYYFFPSKQR